VVFGHISLVEHRKNRVKPMPEGSRRLVHELEKGEKSRRVCVVDDRCRALVGREQVGLQGSQVEDEVCFL
jgi:hypothetical protein